MSLQSAVQVLNLTENERSVISIIGCGGKTSLVKSIAQEQGNAKVLITPTTKIMSMISPKVMLVDTLEKAEKHVAKTGIQCLGIVINKDGKLASLPTDLLKRIMPDYDLVLLEADGSRSLPCKGWLDSEPMIMSETTHTVGVITLDAVGQKVSDETVLRIEEFLELTGLLKGDIISEKTLELMIFADGGMFKNALGKRALFLNKIHDEIDEKKALKFLLKLKEKYSNKCDIFAYGSAIENRWTAI